MSEQEQEQNKVAMVIVAHPDDAEFGTAGTVATLVRNGWDVFYVICNCSLRLSCGVTWCVCYVHIVRLASFASHPKGPGHRSL